MCVYVIHNYVYIIYIYVYCRESVELLHLVSLRGSVSTLKLSPNLRKALKVRTYIVAV